ncbi:hypothetical protein ACLOJK_004903 [Asimina triloba]
MIGLPAFYSPTVGLGLPFLLTHPRHSFSSLSLSLARHIHSSCIIPKNPIYARFAVFPRGLMEMGNPVIGILTAITISGCSLLFLAFLKNVYADSSRRETAEEQEKNEKNPAPKRSVSSGKKKVRFSEDVEEPSKKNVEYRRRRRGGGREKAKFRKRDEDDGRFFERAEQKVVELPDNRSALYSGMYQYRSQMSTLMIYG